MTDWDDLKYFLAVARAGSVTGAARETKLPASTLLRRIRGLEASLGAPLFERSRGGHALTPLGEMAFERAIAAEAEVIAIRRAIEGSGVGRRSVVRIASTEMMAARWLAPLLPELHVMLPKFTFELLTSQSVASLGRMEADVALRLGRPTEQVLVGRRLGTIAYRAYVLDGTSADSVRPIGWPRGMEVPIAKAVESWIGDRTPVLRTASYETQLQATLAGVGQAVLPCFVADKDPRLARSGQGQAQHEAELWAVVHPDFRHDSHVKQLLAFLALKAKMDATGLRG